MDEDERLAQRFEEHRTRLRAVAHRMLGSTAEADDVVQDAWLRLSRADSADIGNLGGWLTTVVARECLHALRSRRRRREQPVDFAVAGLPDPVVTAVDPAEGVARDDSVGLALLVVLDSLSPAERFAFVLHDLFDVPYVEIAPLLKRTQAATRQLASRARRRVRAVDPSAIEREQARQREIVDAFYAAANAGDFGSLMELLDPDVTFRADYGGMRPAAVHRGAETVARQAGSSRGADLVRVLVDGRAGVVAVRDGAPVSLMAFTIAGTRIASIDGIRDQDRVRRLAIGVRSERG